MSCLSFFFKACTSRMGNMAIEGRCSRVHSSGDSSNSDMGIPQRRFRCLKILRGKGEWPPIYTSAFPGGPQACRGTLSNDTSLKPVSAAQIWKTSLPLGELVSIGSCIDLSPILLF